MFIEQIAVFLENSRGKLKECAKVISDAGVDVISMSIADTRDFGILRAITRDNATAVAALKKAGFIVSTNRLIGIIVEDKPGEFTKVLTVLDENGIAIEYMYSFANAEAEHAAIILKVADEAAAARILSASGIRLTCNDRL